MPHATPARRMAGLQGVKRDPDSPASTLLDSQDSVESLDGRTSSGYVPVDLHLHRNGRSDAPTPSERLVEPEPLLREVRARLDMAPLAQDSVTVNEESFFDCSFHDIGKKLKACNDTLGELQQLGVSHDVQLPELVLVGDQSAGKSSLMSGLANLDLPRSEGACTRCPLHIRVSRHTDWSCRVWLRKEYSYKPPIDRPIVEQDVTDEDPFFPWRKRQTTTVLEFKTMHDKSEIEEVLRWAQIAILNDDQPHTKFIPGSGSVTLNSSLAGASEDATAKFSPNVVALEIKGPELPDLSFYDMPGIFQNPADARDNYLVSVVRNLSKAYIQHPSAIIICSMPMNNDAENSCTFGLIRSLESSSRTIGVLTKADLISQGGNYEQWLRILQGQAHQTGLGYFITSRPTDKDLEQLQSWEECAFENHTFDWWPETFWSFEPRCGVEKLKAFLSERLGEEFAKSLPNIKKKIKASLDNITKQLSLLPDLPNNVELEVRTSLKNFTDDACRRLDGFTKTIATLPEDFRDCLLEMKPRVTLKDWTDSPLMEISDDEESDAASVIQTTPNGKRRSTAAASVATPNKRQRVVASGSSLKAEEVQTVFFPAPPPDPLSPAKSSSFADSFAEFHCAGRGFRTLRQVRDDIQRNTRAGRPNLIPDEVYCGLAVEAVKPWYHPMQRLLELTMHQLKGELEAALNQSFTNLKKRFVYRKAREHLSVYLRLNQRAMAEELQQIYDMECEEMFTVNKSALDREMAEEDIVLKRHRHHMRMIAHPRKDCNALPPRPVDWAHLTEEKRQQEMKRREIEVKAIGPDPFEREVEVMAYVRGYYRLAALRFADNVSQRVICRMIPQLRLRLSGFLEKELGLARPDVRSVYEMLMAEDEKTANRRAALRAETTKFETALASIEALETGATRPTEEGVQDTQDDLA